MLNAPELATEWEGPGMVGRFARPRVALFVALLCASVATVGGVGARTARADTLPPPSWTYDLSSNNVVPGPGDPSVEDGQGYLSESDTPGELCPGLNGPSDATSVGIYHAAAGATGPLVVDLSAYIGEYQCTQDVPQATIDDLVANPADYYVQVDSDSYPDGAIRGQLAIVVPTIYLDALAWLCPTGMSFPATDRMIDKNCGAISIPGQDFPGSLGFTSTDYAGMFPWDVRVQGPAGYDRHLADATEDAGGTCDPSTLICRYGSLPFTFFDLQPGPTTVDMGAVPTGMKLAYTHAVIENEPDIAVTYGPGGHVAFDLTGAYNAVPIVRYYFTGSPKLAPPAELPPVVDLAKEPVSANGAIALTIQYGAVEMGNGSVSYALQVATDGGSFKGVASGSKAFATVRELPGHRYQFRVQATDSFGVKSAWVAGETAQLDAIQDTDAAVQYSAFDPPWQTGSTKGALDGTTTWTSDPQADAQLSIDAAEIGVVMPLEPSGGHATVRFGFQSETVDLSASSWQPRQVVAVQDFGGLGTQDVHIQPRGDGRVDFDEVIVLH